MITSGIGSMSSASASRNVIGTISSTVVRLSRNADRTAVVSARLRTTANGRPFESCPARIATQVYAPVGSVTRTTIIIPTSRPSVFQSIASTATSWSIVCVSRTRTAPSSATFVRSTRSLAISASATAKMMMGRAMSPLRVDDECRRPGFPARRGPP